MAGVYFHDLPVYRVAEHDYYAARDKRIDSHVANLSSRLGTLSEKVKAGIKEMIPDIKQRDYDRYGPWRFNDIVGYVRLFFLGSQVRGEYFAVSKKRIVLTRKKVIVFQTLKLAPELDVPRDATNEQILSVVLDYVEDCRREEPRRHFDDTWLREIGPLVDWNAVMRSGWGPPSPAA